MSDAAVPPSAPGAGAARWSGRVAPYADHGPLPLLLLALTAVTGVVDAVSYIALGHVFVANELEPPHHGSLVAWISGRPSMSNAQAP